MRPFSHTRAALLALSLFAVAACQAPAIADWPPEVPAVDAETIESYVARYGHDVPPPTYTPEDLRGLALYLTRRDRAAQLAWPEPAPAPVAADPEPGRSRAEIDAIKRRVERKYESRHDRRHELRGKYGITGSD